MKFLISLILIGISAVIFKLHAPHLLPTEFNKWQILIATVLLIAGLVILAFSKTKCFPNNPPVWVVLLIIAATFIVTSWLTTFT